MECRHLCLCIFPSGFWFRPLVVTCMEKTFFFTSVSGVHSLFIFSHVVVCLLRTWCCWHWVCEQCRAVLRNEDRETLVKYTTQRTNCESTQQSDISTKIWKATLEDNRENKVLKEKGATGNGMEPLHPFCWPKYQLAARSLFTTKVLSTSGILPELMTKTYKNLGSVKVYVPPLGTHCFKLSRGWNAVRIPWDLRSITISVKEKHNQTSWYHKVCRSSSKSAKCACWGLVYSIGGVYTGETAQRFTYHRSGLIVQP